MADQPLSPQTPVATLPTGVDVRRSAEAMAARAGIAAGWVQLFGALTHAVVRPTADAPALALDGPLELVQAAGMIGPGPLTLRGVVAWSDQGIPRMAAGLIEDALSAGVQAVFQGWQQGAAIEAPAAPAAPAPPPRAPRARAKSRSAREVAAPERRPAPAPVDEAHVDLAPELEVLAAQPMPTPPPPANGGWAAAVAASRTTDRRRNTPGPDDLGFDVDGPPDLTRGDVLIHPRFGRCKVLRSAQAGKLTIQRPTGAHIDLHMKSVTFRRLPDEDGKRAFQIKINRPG